MTMMKQFILISFAASIGMQCNAFKEVKRRSALANPYHRHGVKYVNSARSFIPIRGGSSENYDDDEHDETTFNFIASFESELAEIRRGAEMEAENEMKMLRGLIEQKGVTKEEDEEEYDKNIDGSNENNNLNAALDIVNAELTDDGSIEQETLQELPGEREIMDQVESESDKESNYDVAVETVKIDAVDDDTNEETVEVDDEDDLQQSESDLPDDPDELSDNSVESDSEVKDARGDISAHDSTIDSSENADCEVIEKAKSSKKKKRKSSKKGKKKGKKRKHLSEESGLWDEGEDIDLGGSVTVSCDQNELTQPRESGILFYLRSDLGRALGLFVATIALAILTQRMQSQMEAEGI